MKKILIIFASLLLMLLAACSDSSKETQSPSETESNTDSGAEEAEGFDDLFVTVATGGTSGVYYPIGGAISNLLEGTLKIDTSVQATGASVENINLLATNRAELAITMADAVLQAYEGSGAFEGEAPKEELRGLTALYPNFVQIVTTANSGINTVEDLRGKRVGVGAPNSGVELNARLIFEAYGMSYDDINEDYLSYSEAVDQIKNGMIDAAFVTSGVPNATVIDLSTTHPAKIVPIDGAAMDYLEENYPFFSANIIPAGTYDNDEDIPTASITNVLLVNNSLSEDVVYAITKTIFENLDVIHASHNAATNISLDAVSIGMPVPFHPGAEKYFKEVGALK
ncbi:TAXI family TRAP transporter solute-binding subunit [Anaerobacillus sp. CMMVII]|uniref:TAXI family TRAP transporter solute-binding subunit n=1 Tax=Anaerobacillus sp. CMMVII TaxID=2755588 RepID=UPI0021B7E7F7|nr:TAXI family TRAP transporter solute-binding subunit [Anaerobacillus sp. CMMVII]MCT8139345.1 TAXI family TRAP transporter solute-binding subunit [Anaerobacillus sp. CMMVII]